MSKIRIPDSEIWSWGGQNDKPSASRFERGNETGVGAFPPDHRDHNFQMNRADQNIQDIHRQGVLVYDINETYAPQAHYVQNGRLGKTTVGGLTASTNETYAYSSEVTALGVNTLNQAKAYTDQEVTAERNARITEDNKRVLLTGGAMTGALSSPSFVGPLTGNATTSTSLQSARLINGTAFNGGANIETSYWGTTRWFQIGDTGKNVNGSTNVTWTVGEIGAAPAAHGHSPDSIGAAHRARTVGSYFDYTGFSMALVILEHIGRAYTIVVPLDGVSNTYYIKNRGGENADRDYDIGVTVTFTGYIAQMTGFRCNFSSARIM